jgi:dTDP-4-dehydrorhamnose 3,5-epimerase
MKCSPLPFADTFVIQLEPHADDRGMFTRIFCQRDLTQIGHHKKIVQINHSITRKRGALRGMHFQRPPKAEIKLVKCLRGSVFDVIVDLRRNSTSYLKWHGEMLSEDNHKMMYIPEGLAHGFQALEENTELLYLHTEFYDPDCEGGLRHSDPAIGIAWPLEVTEISAKDQHYALLTKDFEGLI